MKFTFGMAGLISTVAFVWHLTDRLQDDVLAMLMGGLVVGVFITMVVFIVLRLSNSDRASERRSNRAQPQPQPQPQGPIVVFAQPRQPEPQERLEQRPQIDSAGYAIPEVSRVQQRQLEQGW